MNLAAEIRLYKALSALLSIALLAGTPWYRFRAIRTPRFVRRHTGAEALFPVQVSRASRPATQSKRGR